MKFKNRISATTKNAPQILEYFQFLFWILKFQSEPENTLHFAKKKRLYCPNGHKNDSKDNVTLFAGKSSKINQFDFIIHRNFVTFNDR